MTRMTRLLALTLALAAGTVAVASENHGFLPPEAAAAITETLTAQGYEVRKIAAEDGLYEVYAIKDGARYEIYFDADLNLVKSKKKN